MADFTNNEEERRAAVAEGMYKGVISKIDEVRQIMGKDLQFNTSQQASIYEAVMGGLKNNLDAVLAELRYISLQNSTIYQNGLDDQEDLRNDILSALESRAEELGKLCSGTGGGVTAEQLQQLLYSLQQRMAQENERLLSDLKAKAEEAERTHAEVLQKQADSLLEEFKKTAEEARDELLSAVRDLKDAVTAVRSEPVERVYDDYASERVGYVQVDYDLLTERVVSALPQLDYEELAQKVAERLPVREEDPAKESAEKTAFNEEAFDYGILAEKIATILPEVDYDLIAERVAAAVPVLDENLLADRVAAAVPETDENSIADKVAEAIPPVDYDLIAERVAAVLESEFDVTVDEAGISKIASAVAGELDTEKLAAQVSEGLDYTRLAAQVNELLDYDRLAEQISGGIDYERLAEQIGGALAAEGGAVAEREREEEPVSAKIDYDEIAARLAALFPRAEEKEEEESRIVGEQLSVFESEPAPEPVKPAEPDYKEIAARVAEILRPYVAPQEPAPVPDYDELVARVTDKLRAEEQPEPAEPDYDAIVARVTDKLRAEEQPEQNKNVEPDYDEIAARLASRLRPAEPVVAEPVQPDYDEIAARLASRLRPAEPVVVEAVQPDYDEIASRLASRLRPAEPVVKEEPDYEKLALRMAEILRPDATDRRHSEPDYEKIASRLAQLMREDENDEEHDCEKIASRVAEILQTDKEEKEGTPEEPDYEKIAARVADLLRPETGADEDESDCEKIASRVAELLRPEQSESYEEPEEEEAPEEPEEDYEEVEVIPPRIKAAPPRDNKPRPITGEIAVAEEPELFVRYKRSFISKIMQSDDSLKQCYGELKNTFMSYANVKSQVNWSNDRFFYNGETIAKVGMGGKTLCLYLALNPEEFPTSVYHQKYAGDKKMYEKTPMMVKIKSGTALKRAVKLIELLMETLGAALGEYERVDFVELYPDKSDEELLEQGLIKTALVPKTDLDSFN